MLNTDFAAFLREFRETWKELKQERSMRNGLKVLFFVIISSLIIGATTNVIVFLVKSAYKRPSSIFGILPNGFEPDSVIINKDSIVYIRDTVYSAGRDVKNVKGDMTETNIEK